MNSQTNVQAAESSFPVGLVMVPMVIGALLWMCAVVAGAGAF